jgi:hypothetical protein
MASEKCESRPASEMNREGAEVSSKLAANFSSLKSSASGSIRTLDRQVGTSWALSSG